LALRIDKEIVGIPTRIDGRNGAAVLHGEDAELSGIPKRYDNSFGILVQSHWKIAAVLDRPTPCLFAGEPVDDRDLARLRDVHEDTPGRAGELKTFRVSLQWNVGDLAVRCRVDRRKCAIAIADENSIGRGIDANVVGIISQIQSSRCLVIRASNSSTEPSPALATKSVSLDGT
jgi:hypothetical protein